MFNVTENVWASHDIAITVIILILIVALLLGFLNCNYGNGFCAVRYFLTFFGEMACNSIKARNPIPNPFSLALTCGISTIANSIPI